MDCTMYIGLDVHEEAVAVVPKNTKGIRHFRIDSKSESSLTIRCINLQRRSLSVFFYFMINRRLF